MFQNNFERWNSACQSFNLTTLLSHIRVSKQFHSSEVPAKWLVMMSRISLRAQIIFCWRFDYIMRAPIWKIDWTIIWALFTNIIILRSDIFVQSVFLVHLVNSLDVLTSRFALTLNARRFFRFEVKLPTWMIESILQRCFETFIDKRLKLWEIKNSCTFRFFVHLV